MNIADIRQEYKLAELNESQAPANPVTFFEKWFEHALHGKVNEPNAMCLSTVGDGRQPHSRIVLLKGISKGGFEFYTNYHSHKGQALVVNPHCALNFFWPELERQVRITGKVQKLTDAESDAYFASRPRASQIGAWVSQQSEVIASRKELDEQMAQTEKNFEGKEVMRPHYWGGFRVMPSEIEFWQGRPNRLHDRLCYTKTSEDAWKLERLSP
ncbi:MAG: pyridoxamine 5'-phosphate oxidase [Bacteroidetes bacterium]|nr:pyridoxamine 5'-phosphate oxidase [Bacteroidota bacterium]